MARRRTQGSETQARLLNWDRSSTAAERLAAHILRSEGFQSLDPAHPLGGPDRLRDIVCVRNNKKWVAASYFPNGQKSFPTIRRKFEADSKGTAKNSADGFAFVTNQKLTLGDREKLATSANSAQVDLYHLERIGSILDSPPLYGVRLDFLDIEMTKEEQLAFFAARDVVLETLRQQLERLSPLLAAIERGDMQQALSFSGAVPLNALREFQSLLTSMTSPISFATVLGSHVQALQVPLDELRQFRAILNEITSLTSPSIALGPHIDKLRIPLDELKEYEQALDRLIEKQKLLSAPKQTTGSA